MNTATITSKPQQQPKSIENQLLEAGIHRQRTEADWLLAVEHLHDLIRKAAEGGMPKTHIAETTGVSRQTVHTILKRS